MAWVDEETKSKIESDRLETWRHVGRNVQPLCLLKSVRIGLL